MLKGVYSVKDELTGYGNCVVSDNDQVAYRDFHYACNSNEIIKLNLKNYSLFKLGVYDTELGVIQTDGYPKLIIDASSCVRKEES